MGRLYSLRRGTATLGWRLSSTDRSPGPFGNEAQSIMDAWRGLVMVHALVRADFELG